MLQRLSNTKLSDFDITKRTTLVTFAPTPDDPNELKIPFIKDPNIIVDADSILQSTFLSDFFQLSPIFHVPQHRRELSYIYERYTSAILSLTQSYPELQLASDDKTKFGEIAFSLLGGIVSTNALEKVSADKILKLRAALAESRESFISKELLDLNELIQTNPWSGPVATEIRKFINGRLRGATTEFERRSADVWSKMRVDLAVSTAQAGKRAFLGGGVGTGILGLIAPGTSMWQMVAAAALAGAASEGPKAAKIIGEAMREAKHNSCSSIAYVSTLRKI